MSSKSKDYQKSYYAKSKASGGASGSAAAMITQISETIPDSERKDFVYQNRANRQMMEYATEHGNTELVENFKKYDYVLINESLPKLEGTEKQIAYAERLRNSAIRSQVDSASKMFGNTESVRKQRIDQMISSYKGDSKVETFNDLMNVLVKENPKGAFKKIKGMKSAKDVIEALTR